MEAGPLITAGALIPVMTGRPLTHRTLPGYDVSLVKHDGRQTLARHRHAEGVIGLLLAGTYDERVERHTVSPNRASVLVKPPETVHANEIGVEGTVTVLIQLSATTAASENFANAMNSTAFITDERVRHLGELLSGELSHDDDASIIGLEGLIAELVRIIERVPEPRVSKPRRMKPWLLKVRDRLHDDPGNRPDLATLAKTASVDRAHLARAFRQTFGCTIGDYLRVVRIRRLAEQLAGTELPLAQLSGELGFYDQSHLTRCFGGMYGMSPARFRRARRADATLVQDGSANP